MIQKKNEDLPINFLIPRMKMCLNQMLIIHVKGWYVRMGSSGSKLLYSINPAQLI